MWKCKKYINWALSCLAVVTHLVVNLFVGALERHILGEDVAILLQLLGLLPIIECSGNVNLFGWMVPSSP